MRRMSPGGGKLEENILKELAYFGFDESDNIESISFNTAEEAKEGLGNSIAEGFTKRLEERYGKRYIKPLLFFHECTENAYNHGKGRIEIFYSLNNTFKLAVFDEGDGFNPDKLPNPTDKQNLCKGGGRGIFIMKLYSDSIRWNEKGNKVGVIKYIG